MHYTKGEAMIEVSLRVAMQDREFLVEITDDRDPKTLLPETQAAGHEVTVQHVIEDAALHAIDAATKAAGQIVIAK